MLMWFAMFLVLELGSVAWITRYRVAFVKESSLLFEQWHQQCGTSASPVIHSWFSTGEQQESGKTKLMRSARRNGL